MNVAVISDTHLPRGTRTLPEGCVEQLRRADLILHAGDLVSAGFLKELLGYGPVEAVVGNMDEPGLGEVLPERRVVVADEARIGMVHIPGAAPGRSARLRRWFPGCEAIVYGHTHVAQVERCDGVWVLNPGSPTERRRSPSHSMLLLQIEGRTIHPRLVDLS